MYLMFHKTSYPDFTTYRHHVRLYTLRFKTIMQKKKLTKTDTQRIQYKTAIDISNKKTLTFWACFEHKDGSYT